MAQHIIVIKQNQFRPGAIRIQAGDSVVWDNQDPHDHTAGGFSPRVRFDTGNIKAGTKSKAIVFPVATSYGGVEVTCQYHGAMEGRIFVSAGGQVGPARAAAVPKAAATPDPGATYSVDTWRVIARIVVGHWIYDMADNFAYAKSQFRGDALMRVNSEWLAIEAYWQQQTGTTKTILADQSNNVDPSAFMDESRDKLEALGRRIRGARRRMRNDGIVGDIPQFPFPARPDDPDEVNPFGRLYGGQSSDPFGEAITVNYAGLRMSPDNFSVLRTEVQLAEVRHEVYALDPLWRIESKQDAGEEITDADKELYRTTRAALLLDDFHVLAAHLYFGLSKLFNSGTFQEAQFVAGIRRMTVRGEWDGSWTPLWHWLRWIDGYITVKETGQLPNPLGFP